MSLAHRLYVYLQGRGVSAALIGGVALAAHGVARATLDVDFLVTERAVLQSSFWQEWPGPERMEVHTGDDEDPLAGVVRLGDARERVDLIVGRQAWMEPVLSRSIPVVVEGHPLPVVDVADLILLKLFAGGPQDLLDVELLLTSQPEELAREVDARLTRLPKKLRTTWRKIVRSLGK